MLPFTRFAWAVLGYNLLVVLWGAFVRATGSGAGCGGSWPLCNGDVILRSMGAETIIEYTHRITSGLALAGVVALWFWARRLFPKGEPARRFAFLSVIFIVVEALLGAGLVVFDLVGKNSSAARAVYLSAHLTNTMILLAVIAATAYHAQPRKITLIERPRVIPAAIAVMILVSISGAVAALGDTVFPAGSVAEGVRRDLHPSSPLLLRLRMLHPALAVAGGFFLLYAATTAARLKLGSAPWAMFILVMVQIVAGAINVALAAPVWMQIVHLGIAQLLWLAVVLIYLRTSGVKAAPLAAAA
ncbi:MAG TPA: COX15/CtaA family protein [Bryobacteraceae bacterium]|nr:COX15/CtaA family protein [Bryobacteraceae bacterium]